jgi:membrane-bound lytic murein transglycosylase B
MKGLYAAWLKAGSYCTMSGKRIAFFGLSSLAFTGALLGACAVTPTLSVDASRANVEPQVQVSEKETPTAVMNQVLMASDLSQSQRFDAWKARFTQEALRKGYAPQLLADTVGRAQINERALEKDTSQPEFTRPVWSYIQTAASPDRIARGRSELAEHRAQLEEIERIYGVPRQILTAIWGLESSYGRIMGTHDIIDSLATFAFEGRRTSFGETQLYAVLDLIQSGAVRRDQLRGSWAGAMGMTQFIPSTFRDYAVDFDRNGNTDLWGSESDALASAANYLTRSGWQVGQPVMSEVIVPDNFDYAGLETERKPVSEWVALGVKPANGLQYSPAAKALEARLLAPAGHRGPKLLTFRNFDAIKKYNNSTSYVMGIASLGQALVGETAIRNPWPEGDQPLTFDDKKALQRALTAQGYDTQGIDGMIGPATRRAIRAWQRDQGVPADGYVEQSLLRRIVNRTAG